jgi:nicotinamide-nucleotide amidase
MKVSILTIGDEILNGTTVDTNSAFIAKTCIANGLAVKATFSISDSYEGIYEGLKMAQLDVDVIFITGGLGPTKDDITKQALANFFGSTLSFNEDVFTKVEAYFAPKGQKQVEINRKLAYIPSNALLIQNDRGTAFGMWFSEQNKIFISMPGVPHEMKYMMTTQIIPKIITDFKLPKIINKYIMTAGIGESGIYEKIEDIEANLPSNISLAYLPNLGGVKLRLSSIQAIGETDREAALSLVQSQIIERVKKYVFSLNENENLASTLGRILTERKETLSTAESCTGGYISHLITQTSGSSNYYEGSVIAYSYDIKESMLGVNPAILNSVGAVSEETVIAMAEGLIIKMKTTYGIAVSGIAGPGGGTTDKPVGTVWIAVGKTGNIKARKFQLTKERDYNIKISASIALNMLRNFILDNIDK